MEIVAIMILLATGSFLIGFAMAKNLHPETEKSLQNTEQTI